MVSDFANLYAFPLRVSEYAPSPVPSLKEWQTLWRAWDLVTTKMIPRRALLEQPIPLRNPLLFYLGHIPAFEDIHLTRASQSPPTVPAQYHNWFERGIDPDVDNPAQCHDHSELPAIWPAVDDILDYRRRVCHRINDVYEDRELIANRTVGRALWIGYEHECLHLETFLYMTILSNNILPPPGSTPDFEEMAMTAKANSVKNEWFRIEKRTLSIGWEDPENDRVGPGRYFAWDNERGPYQANVNPFEAQARPVSVGEYTQYLVANKKISQADIPVLWVREVDANTLSLDAFINSTSMRTIYGLIPLRYTLTWPLTSSWTEANNYAQWKGLRIPTLHEVRSIHAQVEDSKPSTDILDEVSPSAHPDRSTIFTDLEGCNVGLQNFHPTPVTPKGNRLAGLADMGGAWEWTNTLFAPQPGFKPMDIYPGYSADFMDGKHIAIVGGSWAVPPRIAGRKTFLNWWQKGYRYPWVTVRLVRDLVECEMKT